MKTTIWKRTIQAARTFAAIAVLVAGFLSHAQPPVAAPVTAPPGSVHPVEPPPDQVKLRSVPAAQLVPPAPAGQVGPAWSGIGPAATFGGQETLPPNNEVGGAVQSVAIHPTNADIMYVATVNGGVWKTMNGTATSPTWTPLTDTLPSLNMGAIEFDPTDPTFQTVVASSARESSLGGQGGGRIGVIRTTDGGATWTVLGTSLFVNENLSSVAARGAVILTASDQDYTSGFFPSNGSGLFRSTSSGASFTLVSGTNGLPAGPISDLIGDPSNPSRFFAVVRTVGVFRSDDTGATWTNVTGNITGFSVSVVKSEMALFNNGTTSALYIALLGSSAPTSLWRSTTLGTTWTQMDTPATGGQTNVHFAIAVDRNDPKYVYVGGQGGRYRGDATATPGSQFTTLQTPNSGNTAPHTDVREMFCAPNGTLVDTSDGGIFRRPNPTDNTTPWNSAIGNMGCIEAHNVAYDAVCHIAMIGTQDNGCHIQTSSANTVWQWISGGDGGAVAIDDTSTPNTSIRYGSSQSLGGFYRKTYNSSNVLQSTVSPALTVLNSGPAITGSFSTPVQLNKVDATRLIIGASNAAYESLNRGDTVTALTPISSVNGSSSTGGPIAYGGWLNGTPNPDILYYGSGSTVKIRTTAGGAVSSTAGAFPGGTVNDIVLDRNDYRHVFVAGASSVYHSTDSGATWINITGNLTGVGVTRTLEFFKLYGTDCVAVGTDLGVYVSFVNNLGTWQTLGTGFPNAICFDMTYSVQDSVLVVGTLGRGVWKVAIQTTPLTYLTINLTANPVTEGVAPVSATVTATPAPTSDLTVTLTSGDTTEVTLPATVTILAGQTSANFNATIINDTLVDGTQTVNLTASASGYADGTVSLAVQDNETATLSVTAPATTIEGAGTIQGTVTLSVPAGKAVTVSLTSSDVTAVTVPATVVIPAGQTSANFPIGVVDDSKIDGTQNATITAHVVNWTDGVSGNIAVQDNENLNLVLSLPASIIEGATGTGTVSISGTLTTNLTVSLSSNTTSRLTVPATATILAGATSATFTLTAPNNTIIDGNAAVTISASATGFTATNATATVIDNELHHYVINAIGSQQTRGSPFSVTITAQNIGNQTIAGYTGTAALSASGTGGAESITPTTTTAFTAGVWTGNVTVNTFDTNVVLTASDGAGHTGASNAFTVGTGALDHFAWNTQSARARNAAVSATITAQDAGNNTVTSYTGTPILSGYTANPTGASIVITEVNPNTPDEIEFMNVGLSTVNIGGWTIYFYDFDTGATTSKSFVIPAGTTVAAGQIFRLQEFGTAPGTFPLFYYGANINWTSDATSTVGVMLRDSSNNIVDFMCAGALTASSITSPAAIPTSQWSGAQIAGPTNLTFGYLRTGNADTNTSANWTTNTPSIGTVNTGLTTPFPSTFLAVPISPTVSGNFSAGVWTGNMTVSQTTSQMRFRADDTAGHIGDSNAFDVTGTLSLSIPASVPENAAPVTGTVSVSSAPAGNLVVALSSSDPASATVPATVTIPSGQTSATFAITPIDNTLIDGTRVVTVTAHLANWTDATANISVLDNETLSLAVFLPGSVTEGSTATATVSTSGSVASNLTVSLVSNNTSRLTVPATVTIAAGTSSVTFNVTAVDNALTDGSATVNVAASAAGYAGANANTTVLDNDVHHFSIATIASPQTRGVPFGVTISAFDVGNAVITGYAGTPGLTAAGAGGSNAISPANASGFVNGVWTGQVTSFNTDTNVVLTVSDGSGHTGASNAFTVAAPLFSTTVLEEITPANLLSGNNPKAQLIVGADGAFYGTTQFGGSSNQGAVFKVTSAGVMTTLTNFYGANGAQPWSGLMLASDGNFYGTTSSGGANNLGTIFKMTPTGTLTTLVHLSTTTGTVPKAPLIQALDGNFYGTTSANGGSGSGTIFKMTSSGVLTVLVNFAGTTSTAYGSSCQAGLIQANDGNLYGVTSTGGSGGGFGTVFKVTTGGTFTSLVSFTGTTGATLGSAPLAALVQASDGNLYGTTSVGGTGGFGTVFKVTTAGVFTNLLSFTNTTGLALGNSPQGALVQWTDGNLYGTTNAGGTNGVGTIFKVTTAGVLTTLRSLSTTTDGSNPYGALVLGGDGNFYGAATNGGTLLKGTVFNISPATSAFTRVFNFLTSPPVFKRLLLANDGNFYGVTQFGNAGANSIFKLTPGGTLSTLATLTSTSTTAPFLIQGSDGNLYGEAPVESGNGQIFSLTLAGVKTTLATLSGSSGSFLGNNAVGGIVEGADGLIYGTTSGGGSGGGFGTAWKITKGGSFTSLASFTNLTGGTLGSSPQTRMVQHPSGDFYGTTQNGGAGGFGTVFKVTSSGALTTLVQFTGNTGAFLGTNPNTNLLLASDGNFYGTTSGGGTGGFGTIFKMAPDGTFTSLVSFSGNTAVNLCHSPTTNNTQGSDGNFYGTTTNGGAAGIGTVYKMTPAGVLTTLVSFTGTTGAAPGTNPHGTLLQAADGYFYGTTTSGGIYNLGTVFRVNSSGNFQSLYTIGSSNDGGTPNLGSASLYPDSCRLVAGADGYLYGVNASSVFRVHQQPAPQSLAATNLMPTSVTLTGSVVPNQDAATAYYQYGLNTTYGSQTATQNLSAGTGAVPVNANLTGLLPGVIYHFRLVTVTPQGTFYTADQTFATPGAPQVITGSFTNAAQSGFALDGTVNPLGNSTDYHFEYGTDITYGTVTGTQNAGSGIASVPVGVAVNGLAPDTLYHVRLVATNSFGPTYGDDQVIRTFPLPTVTASFEEEEGQSDPDGVLAPTAIATATLQPMSQYLSTGTAPLAGLFKAADGNFYGTLATGGTFGTAGTVYRMSQGGTLTTLANFYNNTNSTLSGNNPQSSLVQGADGNFYGTTNSGGANGVGSIFKMTPAGDVTILVSLNSTSVPLGSNPICGLTVGADGNFYGVTQNGGSSNFGTIFKATPAGVLTTLVSFTGTTGANLGSSPRAALTLAADGNFYGTTATGGAGGFGTIFKVTPAGVLTTLVQFTGTTGAYPGSAPLGAFAQGVDGALYGTTSLGGVNNLGTAFKVTTAATFTSLAAYSGATGAVLGSSPKGALVQMADGNFYGTTQTGGLNNLGTVFSITPAGVLTTLVNFTGSTGAALGQSPQGALVAGADGALYGTTNSGGLNNVGSIFKVTTGGLFTTLVNLTAAPNIGRLVQGANANLYGATLGGGGAIGYGTIFAAPIAGAPNTLATLAPVSGTTALNARAGLLAAADGNFYGTTGAGGAINSGSVFKLTPAGAYTTLISFTGTSGTNPGSGPQAALITGADGNFYGTTSGGGSSSSGTVFKTTSAGVQTVLVNFTGTTGANLGSSPQGPVTLGADGNYYGTTTGGGSGGGFGTVFKMTPAGVLTTLVNFTGSLGSAIGQSPLGVLAQGVDGNFYGVTGSGGLSGLGSVFKVTPAGVFTSLASFTGTTGTMPGTNPIGGLFAGLDGSLYGVTSSGGIYNAGTIFRVSLDGSVTSIYTFTGRSEGLAPNNGLVLASDGYLYGGDALSLYRLNPPPVVLVAPATNVTATSATLNGSIAGNNYNGDVGFEYGLTTAYEIGGTPEQPFGTGNTATTLTADITGLQPFLTYHYRVGAGTLVGTFNSQDMTFSTPNTATFNTAGDVPVMTDGFTASGLPLGLTLGFAPAPGTVLTLVNNTGLTPISGTFNGLPNGAVVTATFGAQTYFFVINYAGGDGNDITLTAVTQAITFPEIPMKLTTDVPFTLGATASSALPVSYTVVAGNASASVTGNTVTLSGTAGVVTIQATQPGNGTTFGPAIPVTRTFAVTTGAAFTQLSSSKTNSTGFTLGIRTGGTLWGWGYNGSGQLGNGTFTTATTPVQIGSVTTWKFVSAGAFHAVAVRTDGTLWAWGTNTYGQVGDGTNTTRTTPVQVGTLTTWAAAVAGYQHTVALKTDGTIWAWGYNFDGELGQGTSDSLTTHTAPVQIGTANTWASISSGAYHILATRTDGTLWAWGYNFYGQVGNASTTNVTAPVQIGTATTWGGITCSYYSSAALRTDGTLWTWGRNAEGQLGDGTLIQRTSPGQLGTATNWQNVQAGGSHLLATRSDGTLWSWGYNLTGQLGQGFNDLTLRGNVPTQVGTATNWSLLAPGFDFSVAAKTDGTVWSWGDNGTNELGYLARTPLPVAEQAGPIVAASAGNGHAAVIKSDGTLWLWGNNANGQLGIGASDSGQHPVPTQPMPGTTWDSVAAGSVHTAAIRSDGTLWTWGYNFYGQLGDGTTTQRTSPVQVGTDTNWQEIAVGYYHTIARKTDGTLWAWGYNSDGQLGSGVADGSTPHPTPTQIGTATNWTHVVSHGYHTIATRSDGTLWGWGYNGYGQIGNGTVTSPVSTPVQVGTATNWSSIATGLYFTTATRANGTLWSWGLNSNGQLGDGTTTNKIAPTQIGTATNWSTVAAGYSHTLATKNDGTLWSWGYNFYSQLGNAGTTQRTSPAQVGTSTGWKDVFPSSYQTLAGTADGTLWACGFANNGSIGYAWRNQFVPDLVLPALTPAQTITFTAPASVTVGATITLGAVTSSGLPAHYIVTGPASLNGSALTVTGPALVTVTAYQPGDNFWQSSDIAVQFINAPLPTVAGVSVSNVTATTATLNATVNPNGTITVAKFQSGPTNTYGTDTPITLSPNNGTADQSAITVFTGLTPGATYHFHATATNAGGITSSSDMMFSTPSLSDANLFGLVPSGGSLAPAFTSSNTSYTDSVSNATSSVTFTPTALNPSSTIQVRVNGGTYAAVGSGTASGPLTLAIGSNTVNVLVTAQDTVTTNLYTIAVTRRTPYQDWAFGLGLGGAALDPNGDFDGDGVKNLHEWAFGTNPASGAGGAIHVNGGAILAHGSPTVVGVPDGFGGVSYFALFGRRKDAVAVGLTYAVEFSEVVGGWNLSSVTPTVIAQDSEMEAVTVPLPPFVLSPPRGYFRVKVTAQ